MPLEVYRCQLGIGDGDPTRVLAGVELRPDAESGPTVRRANQAHDRGQVDERCTAPIHVDVRERPMLDLVPLARARRKVTDRDRQARPIGETLQFSHFHNRRRAPLLPPASAVISSDWAWRYAGRPMCCHQRWIDRTAKLAVS